MRLLAEAARRARPQHVANDWLVTMHFYVLRRLLNAVGTSRGVHFADHVEARAWLRSQPDLDSEWGAYRALEELSRDARYGCALLSARDFEAVHRDYSRVRDALLGALRRDGAQGLPRLEPVDP
jgi:hypothetical protein